MLLTHVFNAYFGARGKGDVDTIALSQLDGVTIDVDLDRSASGCTGIVAGPLDHMGIDIGAFGGVREGGAGRKDGSEDVNWRVYRRGTGSFALIDDLWAVFNSRCDDVRPSVLLVFIRKMPECGVWSAYATIRVIGGIVGRGIIDQ